MLIDALGWGTRAIRNVLHSYLARCILVNYWLTKFGSGLFFFKWLRVSLSEKQKWPLEGNCNVLQWKHPNFNMKKNFFKSPFKANMLDNKIFFQITDNVALEHQSIFLIFSRWCVPIGILKRLIQTTAFRVKRKTRVNLKILEKCRVHFRWHKYR